MPPETAAEWALFAFYTMGSFGGVVYLVSSVVAYFTPTKRRDYQTHLDAYDPWEELTAPFSEPPISARKK